MAGKRGEASCVRSTIRAVPAKGTCPLSFLLAFCSLLVVRRYTTWALRLPLAYLFAYLVGLKADGVWLGMSLSNVISGIVSIFALASSKWQRSRIDVSDSATESEPDAVAEATH